MDGLAELLHELEVEDDQENGGEEILPPGQQVLLCPTAVSILSQAAYKDTTKYFRKLGKAAAERWESVALDTLQVELCSLHYGTMYNKVANRGCLKGSKAENPAAKRDFALELMSSLQPSLFKISHDYIKAMLQAFQKDYVSAGKQVKWKNQEKMIRQMILGIAMKKERVEQRLRHDMEPCWAQALKCEAGKEAKSRLQDQLRDWMMNHAHHLYMTIVYDVVFTTVHEFQQVLHRMVTDE